MTEFTLGNRAVLGLMPEDGIRTLLGPALPDPGAATWSPSPPRRPDDRVAERDATFSQGLRLAWTRSAVPRSRAGA